MQCSPGQPPQGGPSPPQRELEVFESLPAGGACPHKEQPLQQRCPAADQQGAAGEEPGLPGAEQGPELGYNGYVQGVLKGSLGPVPTQMGPLVGCTGHMEGPLVGGCWPMEEHEEPTHEGPMVGTPGPMQEHEGPMARAPGPMQEDEGPMAEAPGPMALAPGPIQEHEGPMTEAHEGPMPGALGPMQEHEGLVVGTPGPMQEYEWAPGPMQEYEGAPGPMQKRPEPKEQEGTEVGQLELLEGPAAGCPGSEEKLDISNLGGGPSTLEVVAVPLGEQVGGHWVAEGSPMSAVALPSLDSKDAAGTDAESASLTTTVSAVLQDTVISDVSDELGSALEENKQKRRKRCRPRKKKRKSDTPDSVDSSWLAELPFSNTDIGTIFEITSQPEKTRKKKNRKQRTLKKNKDGVLKEYQATPNYFISLPITNPKIVGDIEMIQDSVVKKDDRLSKAMVPQGTLHITLFVMHLAGEDDVGRAINAFSESKGAVEEILQGKSLVLSFEGVADFRNEVIFASLTGEDSTESKLQAMRETLEKIFQEKGILVKENKSFTPHLTFMKLSRSPKLRKQGLKKIDLKLYEDFKSHCFGDHTLTSLDLCSMLKKRQPSGYYHCESSITFGPVPQEIPGTNLLTGMRSGDSEDRLHSPPIQETKFEMLPSSRSSIVARKSAVFGSTPTTSFSDHTNNSVSNGRNPFPGQAKQSDGSGCSQEDEEIHQLEKDSLPLKDLTPQDVLEKQLKCKRQQQIQKQDARTSPLLSESDSIPSVQHVDALFQSKMFPSSMKPFALAPTFMEVQTSQSTVQAEGNHHLVGVGGISQLNWDRVEMPAQFSDGNKEISLTEPALSSKTSVLFNVYPASASKQKKSHPRRAGRRLSSRLSNSCQPVTLNDLITLEERRMQAQQDQWECSDRRMSLLEKRLATVQEEQSRTAEGMHEIRKDLALVNQMLGRLMQIFEQPVGISAAFQTVTKEWGPVTVASHISGLSRRDTGEAFSSVASPQEDSSEVDPSPLQRGPKKKKRRSRRRSDILPMN